MPSPVKRKSEEAIRVVHKHAKISRAPVSDGRGKRSSDQLMYQANAMSTDQFQAQYLNTSDLSFSDKQPNTKLSIHFKVASEMSHSELNACFSLVESTSRKDYENSTSFGWHPKWKKREMREAEMRYFLVRYANTTSLDSKDSLEEPPIEGFLSVMLTHDSSPVVQVLYIYEIHLSEQLRGIGLGLHLMRLAEKLARNVGVKKVMLTCFLSNKKALRFYEMQGYVVDEVSPEDRVTRNQVSKMDYVIMSKLVPADSAIEAV